ncbi:uncharacterized protein A4U43_C07F30840 [Asparagus officinalis]|uniref:Uncharacterized protein n=1 Tax=Asparagus officinalis TaxID=4686 RepID=A0A5P1ELE7_ASPOF|nr:uncharacterized protein A4U43_C07F30840 [Asparagus officinalis]
MPIGQDLDVESSIGDRQLLLRLLAVGERQQFCSLISASQLQLMTNTIQSGIDSLLVDVADNISRLAVILLAEKKLG